MLKTNTDKYTCTYWNTWRCRTRPGLVCLTVTACRDERWIIHMKSIKARISCSGQICRRFILQYNISNSWHMCRCLILHHNISTSWLICRRLSLQYNISKSGWTSRWFTMDNCILVFNSWWNATIYEWYWSKTLRIL